MAQPCPLFDPPFIEDNMKHRIWIPGAVLSIGLLFNSIPVLADGAAPGRDNHAADVSVEEEASRIHASNPADDVLEQPVSMHTREGLKRLARARFIADFPALANNYEAQINKLFCGPASGTIVLNALRDRDHADGNPTDPAMVPPEAYQYMTFNPLYKRYTQNTFFNEKTDLVKTRLQVLGQPMPSGAVDFGLQLRQMRGMLEAHGLTADMHVVSPDASRWQAMADLLRNLKEPGDFVIINYQRKAMGQTGGGHFSLLAAYDSTSRSFLVMDVNPMNADWVWVRADLLFKAMQTFDTIENRGYLLVSDPTIAP